MVALQLKGGDIMRLVSVTMLKPDMVLAKSIYYNDCMLLNKGQVNIDKYSESLKKLGIDCVYVEDAKSEGIEIPDAIAEKTRISCKRILRKTINEFASNVILDITDMSETIQSIVDDILSNPDVLICLNDISATDEYTFTHSISTTVYALLIARKLHYNRYSLINLATGTILHDIGKILVDKKILNKKESLSEEEYNYLKLHTTLGYGVLRKCNNISELSKTVVLNHHERMDSSGYPQGVAAGKLHEFSRIVAIADVYDALTSNRCYRKRWSAFQAVNYLIEHSDTKFDTNLVAVFIQQIAIYPNGSLVRLSNNTLGIVKEQNHCMPLRPIVRIIENENREKVNFYEIDLLKELSITILESEIEMNNEGA